MCRNKNKVDQEEGIIVSLKSMPSKDDDIAFYSWQIVFTDFKIGFNHRPKGENNEPY